jgi:hypothetical protein
MEAAGIPYMVTGSMAAIAYGEPRLTNDIDIVLKLNPPDASRLPDIYPETSFYLPPKEVIVVESKRRTRGHFTPRGKKPTYTPREPIRPTNGVWRIEYALNWIVGTPSASPLRNTS